MLPCFASLEGTCLLQGGKHSLVSGILQYLHGVTATFDFLVCRSVPAWEVAVKISVNVLIMMVAILGNLAVVIVVARNKRMQTTTNYYLVNLAISDLMVTLSCTWVHMVDDQTEGWVLGAFFCKINSFMQGRWEVRTLILFYFYLEMLALLNHIWHIMPGQLAKRLSCGFVNRFHYHCGQSDMQMNNYC